MSWIQEHDLGWIFTTLTIVGAVSLLLTILLLPRFVARLPTDYFVTPTRPSLERPRYAVLVKLGRNLLGILLILAGVLMLVLPGQGVLTILIGVALCDGPGKHRLERWLVSRPSVGRALNWIRRRRGVPPLELPQ